MIFNVSGPMPLISKIPLRPSSCTLGISCVLRAKLMMTYLKEYWIENEVLSDGQLM